MSYIFGEFFYTFYFPKMAHIGWTAGLTRQSSLLEFCAVGLELLLAIFDPSVFIATRVHDEKTA